MCESLFLPWEGDFSHFGQSTQGAEGELDDSVMYEIAGGSGVQNSDSNCTRVCGECCGTFLGTYIGKQ